MTTTPTPVVAGDAIMELEADVTALTYHLRRALDVLKGETPLDVSQVQEAERALENCVTGGAGCEWLPVGEVWPAMYRMVLVATDKFEGSAPAINVGYMKYAAGDKDCPYFVCPGAQARFKPLYWCDCLGDAFAPPNWQMKQPAPPEGKENND